MEKGKAILHYNILEKLGEGGMGVVYKAHDTKLDRMVALKFLPSNFTNSKEKRERFTREAKTAATLNHSNICTIYSIDEFDGKQFISMEYIQGTTLRKKLETDKINLSTALNYSSQIVDALVSAHEKGIVHRDIKPENIMVDTHDHIKVMDFGLARINDSQNLTKEGQIVGTTAYMAPEQLKFSKADERSDLFSFGTVLYEMLTGVHPFLGEYEQATWYNLLNQNPDPPSSVRPGITPDIENIVLRCLEKESEKRFQTALDLSVEFEKESLWSIQTSGSKSRYHQHWLHKFARFSPKKWLLTATAIVILLLGSLSVFLLNGNDIPEEKHLAVLPFDNLSSDVIPASMGDGIMEILTSKITRMETQQGSLWVVPSSEIREQHVSSASEATQLFGVNMAVTGSLQRIDDQFLLTINLVDGTTLRNLRSEVLEQEWSGTNFAQLQNEVVETLTRMLELELGPDAVQNILAGGSEDPRAYQLYIEGKGALSQFEDPEKINSAIVLFEQAIDEDPAFALAHAGLAEAYWRKYQLTRDTQWTEIARRYAGEAMELSEELPEGIITLALINNGMGRYEETLNLLAELENEKQHTYEALVQKARAYEGLGNTNQAEETYHLAIEQRKNFWGGYYNLGIFYYRNSQYEKSIQAFRKVTELTPNNPRAYDILGSIYGNLGETEKAIDEFEKSLSIEPTYRTLTNVGTLYLREKKYPDAIQSYKLALEHQSTDYRVWGNLGYAYYYTGEDSLLIQEAMQKAIGMAKKELDVNPNNEELLGDLAGYHLTIGNTNQAKNLLLQLISNDEHNAETQAVIGHLYERFGDRESALIWFERALQNGFPYNYIEDLEQIEGLLEDSRMTELKDKYYND